MNIPLLKKAIARLRWRLKKSEVHRAEAEEEVKKLWATINRLNAALEILNKPEHEARNLLVSMRVHGMSDAKGIGYGVTCFVRQQAVDLIKLHPNLYSDLVRTIAHELARRAIAGILNVNSRGQNCALIFDDKTGGAIGNVFDAGIRRGLKPGQTEAQYRAQEQLADETMQRLQIPDGITQAGLIGPGDK